MIDLAQFRLALAALLDANRAGRAAEFDQCLMVDELARELVQELVERRDRRRPGTRELVARIAKLEQQLVDRDPGERREIICARLGLSRSAFYRLKQSRSQVGLDRGSLRQTARGAPTRMSR